MLQTHECSGTILEPINRSTNQPEIDAETHGPTGTIKGEMVNAVHEQIVKFGEFCYSSKAVDYVIREDVGAVGILFNSGEYVLYISTTGKIDLDISYHAYMKSQDENSSYIKLSPVFIGSRTIPSYVPNIPE